METRVCNFCEEIIRGRQDKKFCDDACRSAFNNKINCDQTNTMRNINNVLRKNRRILEGLLSCVKEGKTKVSGKKIQELGFIFNFHTHTQTTKTGAQYFFCYDYGYMTLKNDYLIVIKKKA
ncbi:MAG: hypothetical protein H7296_03265 [Bacteroidia bacterium]|nr:hypothetical protein [Bacteroidia bacterium]